MTLVNVLVAIGILALLLAVAGRWETLAFFLVLVLWFGLTRPVYFARLWWKTRRQVAELKADLKVF